MTRPSAESVIGVDVGGTFTDLMLLSEDEVRIAKVPSTPANQAIGVLQAIAETGVDLSEVRTILHGTTVTTNSLLERKLSRVGLITTAGFRDTLELGRRTRPTPYGLKGWFEPLIARECRLEVAERLDARGNVVVALDEDSVRSAVRALVELGCEALVIHFLHSYVNPQHECRAAEIAAEIWPNDYITQGHRILSEYREYERGVTAAVNAGVQPVLESYLSTLREGLAARGFRHDLLVMQGNGGTLSSGAAAGTPVKTVMSGPASGVMAAAWVSAAAGVADVITYDMGGTSCDVGLVRGGVPQVSSELELEYAMPIHVPMVDVHTIGAGGGSIARVDEAGLLQVGPQSAGADPGPICYGRGGRLPTITDANLLLGRLDPQGLIAVDRPVSVDRLREAFVEHLGEALRLDAEGAAAAVLRIANERMAGALRLVSLERGHDPRDFSLFAFGGAGPLHASSLARELGIPRVLVPARPGVTNALGCVVASLRHDFVHTVNQPVEKLDMDSVHVILEHQIEEGRAAVERDRVEVEDLSVLHSADMQFEGQSHILTVPFSDTSVSREELQSAFESANWQRFGVELPEIHAVLVNLNTSVIGRRGTPPPGVFVGHGKGAAEPVTRRPVWFDQGWRETPIYNRRDLSPRSRLAGPAIVQQSDCTIVVEPGDVAEVDATGCLVLDPRGAAT